MNFKDIYRLVRKRIVWVLTALFVSFSVYATIVITEKQYFRARSRIIIEIPQIPIPVTTAQKIISVMPYDVQTWQAIISSRLVLDKAYKIIAEKHPKISREVLDQVKVMPAEKSIMWIESTGEDQKLAVDLANAIALAAREYGFEKSNSDIENTKKNTIESKGSNDRLISEIQLAIDREYDLARLNFGITNLISDYESLPPYIASLEGKIRTIEGNIRNNDVQIKEIQNTRVVGKLLNLTIPLAFEETLMSKSPTMVKIEEKLIELKTKLIKVLKTKKETHPDAQNILEEIKELEYEYAEARRKAVGEELDRELIKLSTENSLSRMEINILRGEIDAINKRYDGLTNHYKEYKKLQSQHDEIKQRNVELNKLLDYVKASVRDSYINIIDMADDKSVSITEKKAPKSMPLALLISIIISIAMVYITELLDTTVRTDDDVRRHLGYSLLGIVPSLKKEETLIMKNVKSPLSEVFDTVLTLIESNETIKQKKNKSLLIISAAPEEGKTSVTINLGTAAARRGKSTVIIDGDARLPALHTSLGMENKSGFSDICLGNEKTEDVIVKSEIENLHVVTAGERNSNPYMLFEPARLEPVVKSLTSNFDYTIFDSSPIMHSSDPLKLSNLVDGIILVVESGKVGQRQATWIKHILKSINANVIGVVLTKMKFATEQYYYYYYYKRSS